MQPTMPILHTQRYSQPRNEHGHDRINNIRNNTWSAHMLPILVPRSVDGTTSRKHTKINSRNKHKMQNDVVFDNAQHEQEYYAKHSGKRSVRRFIRVTVLGKNATRFKHGTSNEKRSIYNRRKRHVDDVITKNNDDDDNGHT